MMEWCAGRIFFVSLMWGLLGMFEPVLGQQGGAGQASTGGSEVTPASGDLNLPIPIPTSQRIYEGTDLAIDSCPRNEVDVNGTCHRLLTQGPCQSSDFVLLDPNNYEGYCAARLCAPDRVFVFSDQLCHDPFSSHHCPGAQELFQTAFGTPICQCPDGFLEVGIGRCVSPLTPTLTCPPGQVLWSNDSRSIQVCGPDPCGRLNLDRPLPSPPFVPSLADGTCHQLGQARGVCGGGTFYSLDLEVRRGVCVQLQDAGYNLLNTATHRLYQNLYGPFTVLGHTTAAFSTQGLAGLQHQGDPAAVSVGTGQQLGQPDIPGLPQGDAGLQGATGQGSSHSGGALTDITFGNIIVSDPIGHQVVFGGQQSLGHQVTGHPNKRPHPHHHRNHYIRGHNLGPIRNYKFDSLSKHFTPTRLDLSRLHATRGINHLVRPLFAKTHRGATPPAKAEVVSTRLLAQVLLTGDSRHASLARLQGVLSDTRDGDDDHDHESLEHQDSVADSHQREEKETSATRRRRAAQSVGSSVVETRLVTCRAGARLHVNAKCRHTLLPFFSLPPSSVQPSTGDATTGVLRRSVRSAQPHTPTLSCPQGMSINLNRECA